MRILTNEYLSNIQGSTIVAHGGPARFASGMREFALAHGHEWVGVIHAHNELTVTRATMGDDGTRFFEINSVPATLESLRSLTEYVPPEIYFSDTISSFVSLMQDVVPDIVFLNGYSVFNGLLDIAARRLGIPVVIQHAGIMKKEVEQYRELFTEAGAALCCAMEKETALRAHANIFLNTSSEQAFRSTHAIDTVPHATIVPLPHGSWPFRHKEKKLPQYPALTFGAVARWDRIKNHPALLAFAEAVKETGLPWKIKVVTKIPETTHQADMKERYRNSIEVVPPMHNEELQSFYGSIDIALLPSHFDVSPTVVMEALTFGVPTLISPGVGWVSEYQECSMGDWVTSFEDPHAVISLLQTKLLQDNQLDCSRLASYVETHHKPETVFGIYHDIFAKVLSA